MKKNIFFFFNMKIKNRLYQCLHSLNLKTWCCAMILTAAFQLSVLEMSAVEGIDEGGNSCFQNSGTTVVQEDLREIKPGEEIEELMKAGETHSYKIKLEAGQTVLIDISENGNRIILNSLMPDGETQSETLVHDFTVIYEPLVIIAESSGFYHINLRSSTPNKYILKPQTPRETTERDKKYLAALRLSYEKGEISRDNSLTPEQVYRKQLEKAEEKLAIYKAIGDPKLIEAGIKDVAFIYKGLNEPSKVVRYFKEALNLLSAIDDPAAESRKARESFVIYSEIASASQQLGDYQNALDYRYRALYSSRSIPDKLFDKYLQARALHNTGVVYHVLADEQRALELYEQSLAINVGSVSLPLRAMTLGNIGNLLRGVGADELALDYFNAKNSNDRQKAIEYYKQSLELYRNEKSVKAEAHFLLKIGNTYKELESYSEALNYFEQSLVIYKNLKDTFGQFLVLRSIGNLYLRKGEFQKSAQYFEQAIPLLGTTVNTTGESLNAVAKDYYAIGEVQKALDLYNQSLAFSREREQLNVSATSLFEIAQIERDLGNFANARNRIEEAIQIVESLRAKISAQDIRATYFATVKRYYDFYIDLLMQAHKSQPEKNFDALALQISEKGRSRSLLDLLTISRIDIKQGVDPNLLAREKTIREQLSEKANQQTRLLLAKHTKEEAEKINQEITSLTDLYQTIQTEIRNKSPRYAALTQPKSLDAKQIQQLLDSGTVLLEYLLGEKKSYLWAVSQDSITTFDLPKRGEIESQARKVYELLTARNQTPKNETDEQKRARVKAAEEEYSKAAAELSRMLFGPVLPQTGNKRLLIVPDGALNYIPFAALPLPKKEDLNNTPLGINNEIVTLPSASILALLRGETLNRKSAPKMLAVFADPVFNRSDVRNDSVKFSRTKRKNPTNSKQTDKNLQLNAKLETSFSTRDFERAVRDVGLTGNESNGLPRLPFSRREADSIFKVSSKNLSFKATDFDASKTGIFDSNLEQYRLLHFATHGLLNSQHPELSGIVLSLIDENGRDVDGFLRLQDIYNLKLSADLIVLSACNTALGKDVKGEGLIGLTRGFMYAGAPRVIASLWKVDDAATAELMSIFYRKMLIENLRPAAALRAAQAEMMKQPLYKSPYFWAPFIIQGEWR